MQENSKYYDISMDWPMARHDFHLSGRSRGKGQIRTPSVIGQTRYAIGDNVKLWIADINADGREEYIFAEGGRIRVKDSLGRILWMSPVCNPVIIGFHDLEGTGLEKCIVAVTNLRTLTVFSGLTGEIYWQYVFKRKTVMLSHNRMKIGKINPAIRGEQITVWPEGDEFGYMFSFDQGVRNGTIAWKAKGIGVGDRSRYRPNILVGDLTGSGRNSIIVIQHSLVWLIDVETGQRQLEIQGPHMRNYGYAGLHDTDNDGKPELVLVNDAVQLHLSVIKFVGNRMEYLWDNYIGYGEHIMKTPPLPICDLDGDGHLEIIYSVGDVIANEWSVEIVDSGTGKQKHRIQHARVLDCCDADCDGAVELLLENTKSSEIEIHKFRNESTKVCFSTVQKILPFTGGYRPLHESHIAADRADRYFGDMDGDGYPELLTYDNKTLSTYGWGNNGNIGKKGSLYLRDDLCILGTIDVMGEKKSGLVCKSSRGEDNLKLQLYTFSGEKIAEFDYSADVAMDTPVVTDIDNDGRQEILLGNTVFNILRSNSGERAFAFQKKWFFDESDNNENVFFNSNSGIGFLAAWDFNGDGFKELLFRNTNSELILTEHTGKVLWRKKLRGELKGGTIINCTFGNFLTHDRYDIFVNSATTAAYINECMVLNSSTGEVVWRRNDGHDSGMGPVDGYACVCRLENDGLDDLLFLSGDVFAQIDGKTGKNLVEMKMISDILGTGWIGSGHFTFIDVDGDGREEIFLSGIWGLNGGVLKWDGEYWKPVWFDYYGNATPIGTPPRYSHQGIAVIDGRVLAAGPRHDYKYGCVDAATGENLWIFDIGDCLVGDTCTGDIDGDGYDEFVFGCNDGHVYSLKHDGRLHFKIFTGSPAGNPVLADVDGDGMLEVLVATLEGNLIIIA